MILSHSGLYVSTMLFKKMFPTSRLVMLMTQTKVKLILLKTTLRQKVINSVQYSYSGNRVKTLSFFLMKKGEKELTYEFAHPVKFDGK